MTGMGAQSCRIAKPERKRKSSGKRFPLCAPIPVVPDLEPSSRKQPFASLGSNVLIGRRAEVRLGRHEGLQSGRSGFRCNYSNGRFGVNLNSNSKAPDGLHRALLSQVTSRLFGSEDVEIVDVCHHTVVPSV